MNIKLRINLQGKVSQSYIIQYICTDIGISISINQTFGNGASLIPIQIDIS